VDALAVGGDEGRG